MVELTDLTHLSSDDEEAFIEFERIARREMEYAIGELNHDESWGDARLDYMSTVHAAFWELALGYVGNLGEENRTFDPTDYAWFSQAVKQVKTRLQIRSLRRTAKDYVELTSDDRIALKSEVARLKNRVQRCDELTDERKKSLIKKIDELIAEIEKPRLSLTALAVKIAAISAAIVGVQTAAIKGPETVVSLLDMIHIAVGRDEQRRAAIEHYRQPKAIEHQVAGGDLSKSPRKAGSQTDVDDETPF